MSISLKRLIDMLRLFQSLRNRKFASSVLRMVFRSLELFLKRFIFSFLTRRKVKEREILLRPSQTCLSG